MRIGCTPTAIAARAEGWRLHTRAHDLIRKSGARDSVVARPGPGRCPPPEAWSSDDFSPHRWTFGSMSTPPPWRRTGSTETLDEHMASWPRKRLTYDADFMRWGWARTGGWPRRAPRWLRAYLGEALTTRDLVEPGIYR